MPFSVGDRLGRFEIVGSLGAGGMGEVYRARDLQLQRDVAIKVLPAPFQADPDRRRRFEQEARAAGSLNHPNILAVHDVGVSSALYIVTELLEGETLRERMDGRPLPVRKALDYAVQIASGLAAGHERGIVHRDIKPDNLFVTTDGRIKILDFGLAKLIGEDRRPRPRRSRSTAKQQNAGDRDRGVHVAGTGARPPHRSPHGHLQFRRGALRDAGRLPAVPAGHARRHAATRSCTTIRRHCRGRSLRCRRSSASSATASRRNPRNDFRTSAIWCSIWRAGRSDRRAAPRWPAAGRASRRAIVAGAAILALLAAAAAIGALVADAGCSRRRRPRLIASGR